MEYLLQTVSIKYHNNQHQYDKYLDITKPDECIMFFIQQILQRAKEDRVSLGMYDDSNNNNNQRIDKTKVCMSNSFSI